MEKATVGIVGGGITGLSLAHYLSERGVDSVTFEKTERPGGILRTKNLDGRCLDLSAQRFRLSPPLDDLVADIGLEDDLVYADDDLPLYVYFDGKLRRIPLSPLEAVSTDAISWRGKLRVLLEPLKKGAVEGETVRGFLSRKLGEEACDNCFAPLYSGIYGSDPDEMLYEYSLGRALEKAGISSGAMLVDLAKKALKRKHANLPPSCNFSEGIERLPRALYDENRSRVRLGTPVERTEGTDDGYVLVTDDHHVEVEHLVLTTPSDVAASLLEDVEGAEVSPLRSLNYNPIAVVHVDSDHDGDALGYQVRPDEDFETLGVTWNSSMFDDEERRGVFSCYLGGSDGQGTVEEDDETLGRIATSEFEDVTGTPATLLNVHRWRRGIPAYDLSWKALEELRTPDEVHLCANYVSRAGIPGRVREARAKAEEIAEEVS